MAPTTSHNLKYSRIDDLGLEQKKPKYLETRAERRAKQRKLKKKFRK